LFWLYLLQKGRKTFSLHFSLGLRFRHCQDLRLQYKAFLSLGLRRFFPNRISRFDSESRDSTPNREIRLRIERFDSESNLSIRLLLFRNSLPLRVLRSQSCYATRVERFDGRDARDARDTLSERLRETPLPEIRAESLGSLVERLGSLVERLGLPEIRAEVSRKEGICGTLRYLWQPLGLQLWQPKGARKRDSYKA